LRKTLSNGSLEVRFRAKGTAKGRLATEFFDNSVQLVYHYVVYYSAKCRSAQTSPWSGAAALRFPI
jgi:hypothetical protein